MRRGYCHPDRHARDRLPRCWYCGQLPVAHECAGCNAVAYSCDCEAPPGEFCDACVEREAEDEDA